MQLITRLLNNDQLLQKARTFNNSGIVMQEGLYSYLKINDEYIYELYNFLEGTSPAKTRCSLAISLLGAHVTIAYPEENIVLNSHDVGIVHYFSVISFNYSEIGDKGYYVLIIASQTLSLLRLSYNLSAQPNYKGTLPIEFHITIAKYV